MEKITGKVEAISHKEVETKNGLVVKTGLKIGHLWINLIKNS